MPKLYASIKKRTIKFVQRERSVHASVRAGEREDKDGEQKRK